MADLRDIIARIGNKGLTVAFSGGTDSALVLKTAADVLGTDKVLAVYLSSELMPPAEREEAREFAERLGVGFKSLSFQVLATVANNPVNRCYLCKKALFRALVDLGKPVADGTNADDLKAFRPGLKALKELGIYSPLAMAGLTKAAVRDHAEKMGISIARKPASPCLATRFPYGASLTAAALKTVAEAESFLKNEGFSALRVRKHANVARIELPPADFDRFLQGNYAEKLKKFGFDYITLDVEGLRSGSMDLNVKE